MRTGFSSNKSFWAGVGVLALALWLTHVYNVSNFFRQKSVWAGPYYSAAANLSWPPRFLIDVEDILRYGGLDDVEHEDTYRFQKSKHLEPYFYNDLGYVYLVWFASHLFPFFGHQQATLLFQALVHLLLCSLFIRSTAFSRRWSIGFFLLYALNPIVLKYVVFNHYYFWQSVPALLIVFLALRSTGNKGFLYFALACLPWAILARPTTVLAFPVSLYLLFQSKGRRILLLTLGYSVLVWGLFYKPSQKNVWHTAYVGTGAYRNPYGISLSDDDGYALYEKAFGTKLSLSTGGNGYDLETYQRYQTLSRKVYLTQLSRTPGLYLKNAVVNTLGTFSLGYLSGKPDWLNYLLSCIGLAVLVFLLYSKQWVFVLSILLFSISYTLYYPPVPAYMYGNYALLAGGLLAAFRRIRQTGRSSLIYLSFNDGSDMRINKEVRTLNQVARVELVALGPDPDQCFAAPNVDTLHFIEGKRTAPGTLFRYFAKSAFLLVFRRYDSIHIINEPQLLVLWPFLWLQKRVVLDIFDSIFLRKNQPGNQSSWVKKLVYAPISHCIVTDENRLKLLPDFMKNKAVIIPNYPYQLTNLPQKERTPGLTLLYYGWLGEQRGTMTARHLLAADPNMEVIMAGWLADEPSRALTQHSRVEWLGVLPQAEATTIAARRADYILCVYAPINDNNINASPNKIYDAIQTRTPVIINAEVKVSGFVRDKKVGYVLPRYEAEDYAQVADALFRQRDTYTFDEKLRQYCTWENIEDTLCRVHGLDMP